MQGVSPWQALRTGPPRAEWVGPGGLLQESLGYCIEGPSFCFSMWQCFLTISSAPRSPSASRAPPWQQHPYHWLLMQLGAYSPLLPEFLLGFSLLCVPCLFPRILNPQYPACFLTKPWAGPFWPEAYWLEAFRKGSAAGWGHLGRDLGGSCSASLLASDPGVGTRSRGQERAATFCFLLNIFFLILMKLGRSWGVVVTVINTAGWIQASPSIKTHPREI